MVKNTSSKLDQVFVFIMVFLLCALIYRTESALSSHHEPLSVAGRRMMVYHPNAGPGGTGTPRSKSKPGQKGTRMMTYYKPNGDIFTGPSNSGHGGSHIDQASFP